MQFISTHRIFTTIASLLIIGLFLFNYWVMNDIWLLGRIISQIYAGNGPSWNPDTPTWAFTSILWIAILTLIKPIIHEPYWATFTINCICILSLLTILHFKWQSGKTLLIWALLAAGSNIIIDYTSSGVQSSLTYVCIALAYLTFNKTTKLHWIALTTLFILLTRYDLVFIIAPVWIYFLWQYRTQYKQILISATIITTPIIIWQTYAYWFFGALASPHIQNKTEGFLSIDGLHYWLHIPTFDLWGIIILITGITVGLKSQNKIIKLFAVGIILHITYIGFAIGANTDIGRHPSTSFILASFLLANFLSQIHIPINKYINNTAIPATITIMLVLWGLNSNTHTPLFPEYNIWAGQNPKNLQDVQLHADSRKHGRIFSLANIITNNQSLTPQNTNKILAHLDKHNTTTFIPDTEYGIANTWHSAYYLPTEITVVDHYFYTVEDLDK